LLGNGGAKKIKISVLNEREGAEKASHSPRRIKKKGSGTTASPDRNSRCSTIIPQKKKGLNPLAGGKNHQGDTENWEKKERAIAEVPQGRKKEK